MARVAEPLRAMGAEVETSAAGTAPLRVEGRRLLRPVEWTARVPSAQVKSAILLAALSADGPTTLREATPTRDHTERMLRICGVDVSTDGGSVPLTPGALAPFGYRVPGDRGAGDPGGGGDRRGRCRRAACQGVRPDRRGCCRAARIRGAERSDAG